MVSLCTENDHVLLAAKSGKCVRFPVNAVRVFKSRTSDGVRGIRLGKDDSVVSMSILNGILSSMEEREQFLKIPTDVRKKLKASTNEDEAATVFDSKAFGLELLKAWQYAQSEQFILTVTENGYGKRSSAYEYRVTNRGGQGIINIITSARNGKVVCSFPADDSQHFMIITNQGRLIRCRVDDIRIVGRNTQGVILCGNCDNIESIVAVAPISDVKDADNADDEIAEGGDTDTPIEAPDNNSAGN